MDTDELSEMAYDIIVQAAQISDTLKAELGALSGHYDKEDNWLQGKTKGSHTDKYRNYLKCRAHFE